MSQKRLIYSLLLGSIFTILIWKIFIPYLPNQKIDLFLFYDLSQKPSWYIFYTSNYLREILYLICILLLVKFDKRIKTLTLLLLTIAILRLVIYWLFRGSQNLEVAIGIILMYGVIQLFRWQK